MRLFIASLLGLYSLSSLAGTVELRYSATLTTSGHNWGDAVVFYFTLDGNDVAEATHLDLSSISTDSMSASVLLEGQLIQLDVTDAWGELAYNGSDGYRATTYPIETTIRMSETVTNPGVETVWAFSLYDPHYIGCRTCWIESSLYRDGGSHNGGETYWRDRTVEFSVVPIPAAAWLFASALAGLGWLRRR